MNPARTLMLIGFLGLGLPGVGLVIWARTASSALLDEPVSVDHPPRIIMEPVSISRGEHLVRHVLDCGGCHGVDFSGAKVMDSWLLGRSFAPNLTQGQGGVGEISGERWDRAIRHGVDRNDQPLVYHPAQRYAALSDQDLESVIRYLDRVPKANKAWLDSRPGPLLRLLLATGTATLPALTLDHGTRTLTPEIGPTGEYGRYLARISGCLDCHGPDLGGVRGPPGAPDAPPIHSDALRDWEREDFAGVLQEGLRPDGTRVDPYMPWPAYQGMSEDEIAALWRFLRYTGTHDG